MSQGTSIRWIQKKTSADVVNQSRLDYYFLSPSIG